MAGGGDHGPQAFKNRPATHLIWWRSAVLIRQLTRRALRHQYTTIGHVTIDVLEDGSRRPGGCAFYAALQAARLGLSARIITRGLAPELEQLLAPFRAQFDLDVLPSEHTTTLLTSCAGARRQQRVLAWAGAIGGQIEIDSDILHLAPIARETPTSWRGSCSLLALTPQGLARDWGERAGADALVRLRAPGAEQVELAAGCDALVLSEVERDSCAALAAAAARAGSPVVITAGGAGGTLLLPGERELRLQAAPVRVLRDDIGAGDVFAAAFFIALHEGSRAHDAALFASAAAALRIEGLGASAIPARSDIERRLREIHGPERAR